jgi:ArsR family transcriptional regulator
LIGDREVCVCELVAALDQPQPKISQHLACLRQVGIVEARRAGKWMHYRVATPPDPDAAGILRSTLAWLESNAPLEMESASAGASCCTPLA